MIDRLRTRLDAGRQDSGFTLIELLIVIVILGVLAGIVVFAVGGITDRGDASACAADKKTLEVAQEAYFAKNKAYTSEANLVTEKFLRSQSTLADTNATTGAVTGVGTCAAATPAPSSTP